MPSYSPSPQPVPFDPVGPKAITAELFVKVLGLARVAELAAEPHPAMPEGALWLSAPGAVPLILAALREEELRALARAMGVCDKGTAMEVFRCLAEYA